MHLTKKDIENTERIRRLNIINSVSGIKPANLIGTISGNGQSNLAIFSSVVHLGSDPALLGFILRPQNEVPGDTYSNILETGHYTVNHIHTDFTMKAHYTSAKFNKGESEFDACGFKEEYLFDHPAPFVKESNLKIGMKFLKSVPIEVNNTSLIIGQIEHLVIPDEAINESGYIDLSLVSDVGISGLNLYYRLEKLASYPYARKSELPIFPKNNE